MQLTDASSLYSVINKIWNSPRLTEEHTEKADLEKEHVT